MNTIIRALGSLIALALAGSTLLAETGPESHSDKAAPLSAELAKTCRALAIKAHPTQPAGCLWRGSTALFPGVCSQTGEHGKRGPRKVTCRSRTCQSATAALIRLACPVPSTLAVNVF